MKLKLFSLVIFFAMFGCSEPSQKKESIKPSEEPGVKTEIETLFSESAFDNPIHSKILKELQICFEQENPECPRCAVCSPRFFKIHELKTDEKVENLFALQIKALTILKGKEFALPARHLIVFQREDGGLVKVNGYRGNLIEKIKSDSGVDDLVIRFLMKEEDEDTQLKEDVFFNCLFKWDGKRYQFATVEVIEGRNWGGPVKDEFKKETSEQVYADLIANRLIIPETDIL